MATSVEKKPSSLARRIALAYTDLVKSRAFGDACDSERYVQVSGAEIDALLGETRKKLEHIAGLEERADETAKAGMVDAAHTKALRAASKAARHALKDLKSSS